MHRRRPPMPAEREEAADIDASLSLLEPLLPAGRGRPRDGPVVPDVVDPALLEHTVAVPRSIEKLFKSVEDISFIYTIEDGEHIVIRGADGTAFRILVAAYDAFCFPPDPAAQLLFAVGRRRYRTSLRSAQRREYLASAGKGEQYEAADLFGAQRRRYLEYQLRTGLNIVYIEDACDLHREIRTVAALLGRRRRYTPKVRNRGEEQRAEHFKDVLQSIPGISRHSAAGIYERFPSFGELRRALLHDREAVAGIVVCDAAGRGGRVLGEKRCRRLADALLSEDRDKRI